MDEKTAVTYPIAKDELKTSIQLPGSLCCYTETAIIWKYSPTRFTYLRESIYWTMRPREPIHGWAGEGIRLQTLEELKAVAGSEVDRRLIIGYAEVRNTHSREGYGRRYWWLRTYDRDVSPGGIYATRAPAEAVVPLSVEVNSQSCHFTGRRDSRSNGDISAKGKPKKQQQKYKGDSNGKHCVLNRLRI